MKLPADGTLVPGPFEFHKDLGDMGKQIIRTLRHFEVTA